MIKITIKDLEATGISLATLKQIKKCIKILVLMILNTPRKLSQ